MPVQVESAISGPFYPNGVTTSFAFEFKAVSGSEVAVVDDGGLPLSSALYSVTLNGGEGGTVTFSVAPAASVYPKIFIAGVPSLTQPSDFDNTGPSFNPASVTRAFDRARVVDLRQQAEIDRSLKTPFGELPPEMNSMADSDGKVLAMVGGKITPIVNDPASAEDAAYRSALSAETARLDRLAVAADRQATATDRAGAAAARLAAEQARDITLQTASAIPYADWAALDAVTGGAGDAAVVFEDAGTHTDPVVGGTVDNAGYYLWSTSPAGWERIADTEAVKAATLVAEATGLIDANARINPLFEEPTTTNLYAPDTDAALPVGARAPANYNSDGTWGTTLSYFGTTGIITGLAPGEWYTVGLVTAPIGITLSRAQGGFFWDGSNDFSSRVAHDGDEMNFADGNRSVTFQAVTSRVSFNIVRAPDTEAMADVFDEVLGSLMVNAGTTLLPYDPPVYADSPYVPGPAFDAGRASLDDDVAVQTAGDAYFYLRTRWNDTYDQVQKLRAGMDPLTDPLFTRQHNGHFDHFGCRLIPIGTSIAKTRAAFEVATQGLRGGIDEGPPINFNVMYLGGAHGVVARLCTIAGHGKTYADIGSRWLDTAGRTWVIAFITGTDQIKLLGEASGTAEDWRIFVQPVTGSLTHVAGATNTGAMTAPTVDAVTQLQPCLKRYSIDVYVDGAAVSLLEEGVYSGGEVSFHERYEVPNAASVRDWLIANAGAFSANPDSYAPDTIQTQVEFGYRHSFDWTGAWAAIASLYAVQNFSFASGGYWAPLQSPPPNLNGGASRHMIVPRMDEFTQNAVTYDLAGGVDVTANANTVQLFAADWTDPLDPPSRFAQVVKSGGGVMTHGLLQAIGRQASGAPAERAAQVNRAMFFSGVEKQYPAVIDGKITPVAGQLFEAVGYSLTVNPATAPAFDFAAFWTEDGRTIFYGYSIAGLADQWIELPLRLMGNKVTAIRGGSALKSRIVGDRGIRIALPARGEIEVLFER